jgi:hypothetical protein
MSKKANTQFDEKSYQVDDLLILLNQINITRKYESDDQRIKDRNVIHAIEKYAKLMGVGEIKFEHVKSGKNYGGSCFNPAAWKLKSGQQLIPDSIVTLLREGKGLGKIQPIVKNHRREFSTAVPEDEKFKKIIHEELVVSPEHFLKKHQTQIENGKEAERIAFEFEKKRLGEIDESWLVTRPKYYGDKPAAGYDILSKNEDGTDRFIEVKSISEPIQIYISRNELEKSQTLKGYYLYCVNIEKEKVYPIPQPNFNDEAHFKMEPINFLVSFQIEKQN